MDNHPIPQDVTGFQFKLIGDMTVKQFAYLAVGIISGWVVFSLPLTYLISAPVAVILVLIGIVFAFVPIGGRPADAMTANFIKSIFSPAQYVYKQPALGIHMPPKSKTDFQAPLAKQTTIPFVPQEPKTQEPPTAPSAQTSPSVEITIQNENEELEKKEEKLEEKIEEIKTEEQKLKEEEVTSDQSLAEEAHKKLLALEQQLQETLTEKERLSEQIVELKKKLNLDKKNVFKPSVAEVPMPQTPNVRKIPQEMSKRVGIPIVPTVPNVVTGIVKNPRGNPLAGILVEIRDKEENPVRAFKTSQVGYFASATPLPNGVYTLIFEDPKGENKFDTIEISMQNEIVAPIEVVSVDAREELRKSLFEKSTKIT